MAETHELRLKIDAAAAKAGSREFTAAVDAVKRAVRDLERDSSGAFTKLRKNIKDASALGGLKLGVDKQSIRDLNTFAAAHEQIAKSAATSEKSVKSLSRVVQGLADSYRAATMTADQFAASILKTNSGLMRQIQLASQARSAVRQIRTAPTATAEGTTTSVRRGSTATNPEVAGLATGANAGAKSVEAAQSAIQRAIASSRTEVERLTVSLMKMGGFGAMSQLHRDFQLFSTAAGKAGITTKELAAAKERFATSAANARTAVVTLTAKTQDEARAANELARAEKAAEAATKARASAQLSASAAARSAEAEAQRLANRLREMGDVRGVQQLNQALISLKANLSSGGKSSQEIRTAMDQFAQAAARARSALAAHESAMKSAKQEAAALAAEKRRVADSARAVEREMRSIAGANNAVARSFRDATGNMRGLENAFSATFQAGSLFRNMLGSLTFGTFVRGVYEAGNALDQFRVTMEVATGSARGGMEELEYIDGVASRLGIALQSARDNYSKFAVSASIAGVSAQETQKIFESVSTALSVLGKGTEDQNLAFLALEQMMSKGTVSSEELRRQLGERLPGAVNMMAQALGVTTAELNDMLKAGEIASADALPKFADVIMERFGPGLEQASTRAGNNLQKLRNEIQLFLEEVAQSGFMQELAVQFRALTDVMASGEASNAARRLGEALANGARIGGEALQWLIENIETVGTVLKAVGIGIIVRQFTLFGQAVSTSAMQISGYVASLANGARGTTAAELATIKHTAALEANTAALLRNSGMTTRAGASSVAYARSQEQAARRALTAQRSTLALNGAMGAFGAAAGAAATAAGVLSRALSVIAPVVGIAVTAMLLIPGAMDSIGLGADKMGLKIEAALSRSGAKFDEFGTTIRENSAVGMMTGLLQDLQTLEGVIDHVSQQTSGGLFANLLGVSQIEALTLATGKANLELGRMEKFFANIGTWAGGIDDAGLTGAAATAAKDIFLTYQKVHDGQATAVELQQRIDDAVMRFPQAAPFFTVWNDLNRQILQAEQGIINTKQRLTELYGTRDEQTISGFVKMAEQVYKTGEGMDALIEQQKAVAAENPHLASSLEQIMTSWNQSFARGDSALAWMQEVSNAYTGTADKIVGLREEVDRTNQMFGASMDTVRNKVAEAAEAMSRMQTGEGFMSNFILTPVPEETIASYERLVEQFLNFQSGDGLAVNLDSLTLFSQSMAASTPAVAQFTDAVMSQFSALSQSEQTYARLDSIIRQTAAQYPQLGAEVSAASAKLLEHARAGETSAMAYSDLERAINALPWPTEEAREAAMAVLEAAYNTQTLGNSADAATGGLYAAADGTDAIGAGAAAASAQVRALQAALAALGAVGAGVPAAAAAIVDDINFQTRLKTSAVWEREMLTFEREQMKSLNEARTAALNAEGASDGPIRAQIEADYAAGVEAIRTGMADIEAASKGLYEAEAWQDPKKGGGGRGRGGKGGGGRSSALSEEQKAIDQLNKSITERLGKLEEERLVLELLATGQFETAEAAQLMAQAMVAGGGAVDAQTAAMIRQIDVATKLNEELQKAARDPVKEWMDSVPNWIEAGKQIEMGAIDSLKGAISDFIKTGKFDFESLGEAILGTIADIVADKAVAELMNLMGRGDPNSKGLGGILGNLFASQGDTPVPGMNDQGTMQAMISGSQQAGSTISTAMIQAGQQVSTQLQAAMTGGGAQAGASVQSGLATGSVSVRQASQQGLAMGSNNIRMAASTGGQQLGQGVVMGAQQGAPILAQGVAMGAAGGGGGGFLSGIGGFGGLLGMVLGAFSEGGVSTSPVGSTVMPASAFRHAPHFSQGTTNTSGIPAVLHPNEAVIPLSKNRKIPVEMGEAGGGNTTVVNQTFNITTNDADSFRRSQKQVAADMASAGQRAVSQNR
ncbi:tape measure protein [Rhodobacter phage RcXuper]|nr:tape measure protein [Rhodobacter phage RcXuper]